MTPNPTLQTDSQQVRVELERVQAFLAVVLAERVGPLTNLQRELLQSVATAIDQLERSERNRIDRSI